MIFAALVGQFNSFIVVVKKKKNKKKTLSMPEILQWKS